MTPVHRSMFLLLLAMTIWGSTFAVTKDVITQLPPLTLAFARVVIGALVLAPFAWRRRESPSPPWRSLILLAFVGVGFYYMIFNLALAHTSAVQGALVQSSIPAMTALIAVLWLRERATPLRWFGIALSIAGVLIVFSGGGARGPEETLLGNALMFASVIAWGVYTSLAKRVAGYDAVVVTAWLMVIGAFMLAPLAALELAGRGGWPTLGVRSWVGLSYLGVMASGVAYLLYNGALRCMEASQAGAFTNLIPIVGVLTGVIVLGETLTVAAMIGGGVVMLGVWIAGGRGASTASDTPVCPQRT